MGHRKILGIVGMPYNGSTIIQYILNTHPLIRSFGEIYHIERTFSRDNQTPLAYCSSCGERHCPIFFDIPWEGDIYAQLYNRSDPKVQLLVDSSKSVPWYAYLDAQGISDRYEMHYLYLVREPISWTTSFVNHNGGTHTVALQAWLDGDTIIRNYLQPKANVVVLDYKAFRNTEIQAMLLSQWGVPIVPLDTENYFHVPIHQVGGNANAFYGQKPFCAVTEQIDRQKIPEAQIEQATQRYYALLRGDYGQPRIFAE